MSQYLGWPGLHARRAEPPLGNPIDFSKRLLGKKLHFWVRISHAENLPENFGRDIGCFYDDEDLGILDRNERHETEVFKGLSQEPCFNYAKLHCIESVTQEHLDFMENQHLTIFIFGIPKFKPKAEKDGLQNFGKDLSYWLPPD